MVVNKNENIGMTLQLIKSDGISVEETATVTYRIFDSTGVTEVVSVQVAAFNSTTESYVDTLIPSASWTDQEVGSYLIVWSVSDTEDDFNNTYTEDLQINLDKTDLDFLKDINGGRWVRDGSQMIFYGENNITEIARFNLFKFDGSPATEDDLEVAERVRV